MAQTTDLNVAPYYDDFDKSKNYKRVLFRPGFAIQARELTQLQSALQHQVEAHGSHIFEEGAMVIPGQISLNQKYASVKLENTFNSENVSLAQYYNEDSPVTITGITSGVKAQVIGYENSSSTDQSVLYVMYTSAGTNETATVFTEGENLKANIGITHTSAIDADVASATVFTSTSSILDDPKGPACRNGAAAQIEPGVYYVNGHFVETTRQTLVLDKYSASPSYRIGWSVAESIQTPEAEASLTDNAQGSANFSAKGAHRLVITLTLAKLPLSSTNDANFVELMTIKNGTILSRVRTTEYSEIEETFARRTFDESGDYTVRPFQMEARESVTIDEEEGVYNLGDETDDGGTASDDMLAVKLSPGKAYIKGYEIEKLAPTFKDVKKARDTARVTSGISNWSMGNYCLVDMIYNSPDISKGGTTVDPYKPLFIYDQVIGTKSENTEPSGAGSIIGVCRSRQFIHHSGSAGGTGNDFFSQYDYNTNKYKLYLFDIRMFTSLTLSGTPAATLLANHSNGGVRVTGETSGAVGLVYATGTSGTNCNLTNIVGSFQVGEKLFASDRAGYVVTSAPADITISAVVTNSFSAAKAVFHDDATAHQGFLANIGLNEEVTLNGTWRTETTGNYLEGVSGYDTSQLRVGDLVTIPSGAGATETVRVTVVAADKVTLSAVSADAIISSNIVRLRAKLFDSEKNISLLKLNKNTIKTLLTPASSPQSYTQFNAYHQFEPASASDGSGVITFPALGAGETYASGANKSDYVVSITAEGNGTGKKGDIVDHVGKVDNSALELTEAAVFGTSGTSVKITALVTKTQVTQRSKSTKLCKELKVFSAGATAPWGTKQSDKHISLGRSDAFKLVCVFDSEDASSDAAAPTLTNDGVIDNGPFVRGEIVTGQTSGAKARLISITSPFKYVPIGTTEFINGEEVKGDSWTGRSAIPTTTLHGSAAVTAGSTVITSQFLLDTGQRDNYYDISSIVRKDGIAAPIGRLLVIYDYLEHGAGDVFSVDSYTDVANQMGYENVPVYSATKVDPDSPEPAGIYPLTDCYDFRPTVVEITGTDVYANVDRITANSFNFHHRGFNTAGGDRYTRFPPHGANVQSTYDYYLNKYALIFMDQKGNITVKEGVSAEVPQLPKPVENGMLLATLYLPAFTFKPKDIEITREKNQRYTMKDIGKLKTRLDHVEYYTALSMLERDAESFEITDSNGLNRFKSGFVVDNFTGHRVGDAMNLDYKCSIDMENNELRPKNKAESVFLEEVATTAAERTSAGYQKTGDLLTLPYTEQEFTSQPYATRLERVTPILISNWVGHIELSPSGDEWFETQIAPQLIINVEGNFDTFFAANKDKIGTVWNAWQTQWSGVVSRSDRRVSQGNGTVRRTITTTRTDLERKGIKTEVVAQIDEESQGSRVIATAIIPWCRSRTVTFEGTGFLPNTRVYPFFDKKAVSSLVTPEAGFSFLNGVVVDPIIAGSPLVTSPAGKVRGTFLIPDPTVAGNLKFSTGETQFRLTSSETNNIKVDPATAGDAIYYAKGILETHQETIIATRNARLVRTNVSQTTSQTNSSTSFSDFQAEQQDNSDSESSEGASDPLAQTFMVDQNGGAFVTSIDVWFGEKDADLPVTCEIRNVVNGYPGPKVLPFGRKTLEPSEVSLSDNASVATKFTFPSPVYLEEGKEYCMVFMTALPTWKIWICRMGEQEVGGSRNVSEQPHTGVMFKSHNNRAWAMSGTEDIKFTINTAKFSPTTGTVNLQNTTIPSKKLRTNAVTLQHGLTTQIINHTDHSMYHTSNDVTISGVSAGLETTLAAAINDGVVNTCTLTTGNLANFKMTTGRWAAKGGVHYIKIDDEIISFATADLNTGTGVITNATRGALSTIAASHTINSKAEYYMMHQVPLSEINKTHTSIGNIGIDSYTITTSSSTVIQGGVSYAAGPPVVPPTSAGIGGSNIYATQNYMFDTVQTMISAMELPGTTIESKIRPTTSTSPNGSQTSFTTTSSSNAIGFPLNDNYDFDEPYMICSSPNETGQMSGTKSLLMPITLSTTNTNISPVIDTDRMSIIAVTNRMNAVYSSSDVYPSWDYISSTEPNGDNNAGIYMTKKVILDTPATALKVFFGANRASSASIRLMYKILRNDEAMDFDELGWEYFNPVYATNVLQHASSGLPDITANPSLDADDFQQYVYTAGVKDDGIGTSLEPFVSFSIKIIMTGTNTSQPPRIKDLRCIALAT